MADFGGDVEAFRADARAWLAANFPVALKAEPGRRTGADAQAWRKRMADQGWGAPSWPKAFGGGGRLSRGEARALTPRR